MLVDLRRHWQTGIAVLLILAVSALFRLWGIESAPPGLYTDEAVNGMDALDVLGGRGGVFFPDNYGREGLNMYFIAGLFKVVGVSSLAIRLSSVIGGIFTPLAMYWLGRELFRSENRERKLVAVPLMAALWLTTAYWAVSFSRLGLRGAHTILFGTLAFAALWRGVNQSQSSRPPGQTGGLLALCRSHGCSWFLLSGVFLGLSLHFYSISRIYPLFLGLFLVVQAAVAWAQKPHSKEWGRDSVLHTFWGPIVGLLAVAAVVFAPLGWYFLTHPGTFTQRARVVSAFGTEAAPWATITRSVASNVAQFFLPGQGDTQWINNLPGRPVFEPLSAVLAIVGFLICLRCWRRPHYLLLLMWWPTMLLPAFLATDVMPSSWRAMGAMPAVYFFPAIAVGRGLDWLRSRGLPALVRQALVATLLVVPVSVAAIWTAHDYMTWASSPETYDSFEGDVVEAARWLKANPQPWPVYVSSTLYRHPSFMFEYGQVPTSQFLTFRDEAVRWFDGRSALPLPPDTHEALYLLTSSADPGEEWLDRYLPDRQLVYQSFDPAHEPSLSVFRAGYRDRREVQSATTLIDGVQVTGYGIYGQTQPGDSLRVALHWRFAGPQTEWETGLHVQVALLDDRDHQWAMSEQALSYPPPEWDTDSQAVSWTQIVLPGQAPRSAYNLAVRLVDGRAGTPLGEWARMVGSERVEVAPSAPLVTYGATLRLLAASAQVETVAGGKQVIAELVFDATAPQPWSYTLFLHALDANDQRVGQRDTATGHGLFPTDAWQPGQPHREIYRIPIDAVGAAPPFRLALGFYDWRSGERLPALDRRGNRLPDDCFVLEIP